VQCRTENDQERQKAIEALKQALLEIKDGKDFEKTERKYTTRREEEQGKVIEIADIDRIYPSLKDALTKLEPGEISDIVEVRHGFMLVKLTEHIPSKITPLSDVEYHCRNAITREKLEEELREEIEKRKIEIDRETLFNPNLQPTDIVAKGENLVVRAKDVRRLQPVKDQSNETAKTVAENAVSGTIKSFLLGQRGRDDNLDSTEAFLKVLIGWQNRVLFALELDRQMSECAADIVADETDARNEYEANSELYTSGVQEQILVIDFPSQHEKETLPGRIHFAWERARDECNAALEKIKAGKKFEDLVEERLEGPSPGLTGLSPLMPRDELPKYRAPLDRLAAEMEVGEVSSLVKHRSGYLIFRLEDRKPPCLKPFDKVREEVFRQARLDKRRRIQNGLLAPVCKDLGFMMLK